MKKYVLGLFNNREDAEAAIADLDQAHLSDVDFGLFARDAGLREALDANSEESGIAKSAGYGAAVGGAAGVFVGAVAGASLFLIPGVGQLLGIGTLAAAIGTALTGTGLGAAGGAFMGALVGYGASEEDANFYVEGMKRGGVLVVVNAPEASLVDVATILERHNVVNVEVRQEEWKAQGWDSYTEHVEMDNHPRDIS